MKKLRSAVVGVGYLGNFHAQKYKNNSHCELVGVCDAFVETAKKRSEELSVPYFTDPKELVGKVDLVTIAASTTHHYELAAMFLKAGIAVNVEKPMTATLQQAESLLDIHQKTKTLLTVGHIERFNPAIRELKKQVSGQSSLPYHFELTRWATFKARGSDVSVVYDLMIHDLDLVFDLTQSEVVDFMVSGSSLVSKELDSVQASFKMKNQQTVQVTVSRVSPKMVRNIKAYCSHKIVNANTASLELDIQTLNRTPQNNDDLVSSQSIQVAKVDALQEETNHFVDCVLGKATPLITAIDGLRSMQWADKLTNEIIRGC
ncbi:MAG: Gfo/Idh/MocA family oxidoreductase [Bdellovibrionaceae bacterium]|nr:Gfo/Idh/MocA family oxidoreductase [Pseudobdellovibrionaceae bacterium]NUM59480.1 Gfo/Idh/MocA family oxidoreductase [Pseudobdellovibrionaceae bacterium]